MDESPTLGKLGGNFGRKREMKKYRKRRKKGMEANGEEREGKGGKKRKGARKQGRNRGKEKG